MGLRTEVDGSISIAILASIKTKLSLNKTLRIVILPLSYLGYFNIISSLQVSSNNTINHPSVKSSSFLLAKFDRTTLLIFTPLNQVGMGLGNLHFPYLLTQEINPKVILDFATLQPRLDSNSWFCSITSSYPLIEYLNPAPTKAKLVIKQIKAQVLQGTQPLIVKIQPPSHKRGMFSSLLLKRNLLGIIKASQL